MYRQLYFITAVIYYTLKNEKNNDETVKKEMLLRDTVFNTLKSYFPNYCKSRTWAYEKRNKYREAYWMNEISYTKNSSSYFIQEQVEVIPLDITNLLELLKKNKIRYKYTIYQNGDIHISFTNKNKIFGPIVYKIYVESDELKNKFIDYFYKIKKISSEKYLEYQLTGTIQKIVERRDHNA